MKGSSTKEAAPPSDPAKSDPQTTASAPIIPHGTERVNEGQCPVRLLAGALSRDAVMRRIMPICIQERCSWWLEVGGCAMLAVGEGSLAIAEILDSKLN